MNESRRDIFATQMLRVRHMNSSIHSSKFRVIAVENGIDIYVEETPFNTVEVDTEEDLQRVEEIFRSAG